MSRTPPLTEDDVSYLSQFLASDSCEDDALNVHQLRGFLWSVVASPIVLHPDDWLPVIFGDVKEDGLEKSPFQNQEEAERVLSIIRRLYQQTDHYLLTATSPLATDYAFNDDSQSLSDWCQGLLMGYGWLEDIWDESFELEEVDVLKQAIESALGCVSIFADIPAALAEAEDADKMRTSLPMLHRDVLPVALLEYARAGRKLNEEAQAIAALYAKTGRNDPCPCGSGKKFKHCCLA